MAFEEAVGIPDDRTPLRLPKYFYEPSSWDDP
jgi:hypothetical protein